MRVAAKIVLVGMAVCMLGAADARAPNLVETPTSITTDTAREASHPMAMIASRNQQGLSGNNPGSASTDDPSSDFWLLTGVCLGLIGYQLRRKHRQLKPQPFISQADL